MLGGPVFEAHLELFTITLTFFKLDVPDLEILKIRDIPGMSFNFIMPFHNDVSKSVHWYSQHHKIGLKLASQSTFVDQRNPS